MKSRSGGTKFKEKDDPDLVLFRDLHRRENDHLSSLLQPVTEDHYEPDRGTGNYALFRISSGRKGSAYDFFPENDKNDYDWLKTPPATPLFPSIEMEANIPPLLTKRDIPVLQPPSRFRDDPAPIRVTSAKAGDKTRRPKTPLNQTQRPNITSETKTTTHQTHNRKHNVLSTSKDTHIDYLTSNLTKHTTNTKTPTPRSTLRDIPGFSNETPPNLVTDISRSISATRSRPDANRSTSVNKSRPVPRRQSCSPSVTRGRDVTSSIKIENDQMSRNKISGTHVLGSRMVERMMNARSTATKVCSEDRRESTARLKSRTSLDYTSRNMVTKRDRICYGHSGKD